MNNVDINMDGIIDANDIGEVQSQFEVKVLNSTKLELYEEYSYEDEADVMKYKRTYYYTKM